MKDYEINESTQAIIPLGNDKCMVYEEDCEYEITNSSNKIIKHNCSFYGSSYVGRCEGTKYLTGIKTKFPIIIEESRKIIFFPTTSIRTQQSSWIALNHIKDIKLEDNKTMIIFNNDKKIIIPISYYSLKNQYCRASLLKAKLYDRIRKES